MYMVCTKSILQNALILEIYVKFLYYDYDYHQHLNMIYVG